MYHSAESYRRHCAPVSARLLHLLHSGDGRCEPVRPSAYRQRVHLPTGQATGGLEVPILHGAACWVSALAYYYYYYYYYYFIEFLTSQL